MYLVVIAWMYVALMMGITEAMHSNGTVLGGIITFILYGLLPVALVVYLMGTPARRKALRAREVAAAQTAPSDGLPPDAGGQAATDTITPVRKE